MQAGFLCLEAGLTRTKNSINVATKNLTDFGISVLVFWGFGFALMFGASAHGWIGTNYFFVELPENGAGGKFAAFFLYQTMFCGTAVTIISGAVAERVRFMGYLLISVVVSAFVYPIFGHWAWGGEELIGGREGWLRAKGFVDFAGSTVVHSVGGWAALAVLLVIGPRQGRFLNGKRPRSMAASNLPLAILGVLFLWIGWVGFNGGGYFAMTGQVSAIVVRTMLAGGAGLITALFLARFLCGHPNTILLMNGSLAGLVAITACCHAIPTYAAVLVGAGGAFCMFCLHFLLLRLRVDDAVGAVPVHVGAGVWGTMAVALFGDLERMGTTLTRWEQLAVQGLGVGVCFAVAFGGTLILIRIISACVSLRVSEADEGIGLNVVEHRASTELVDLISVMDYQAYSKDLSMRAPGDSYTEVGQIGLYYNRVVSALDQSITELSQSKRDLHRLNDSLEQRVAERTRALEVVNEHLERLTVQDPLTGLLNRRGLQDVLQTPESRGGLANTSFVVLIVDLDDFKAINDTLGHSVGDVVLREIARRMQSALRSTDNIARVGGDEFMALLPNTSTREGEELAERLRLRISEPIGHATSGDSLRVTASVGLISVQDETPSIDQLLTETHNVLYRSKREGKDRVSTPNLLGELGASGNKIAAVVRSLQRETLRVVAQPIVRLRDGGIYGYELLSRGSTPGFENPRDFFRASEECKAVTKVDSLCLRKCLEESAKLAAGTVRHINILPSTLFSVPINTILDGFPKGAQFSDYCFEISERELFGEPTMLEKSVRMLRQMGCKIALDNVGFGRSCFEFMLLLQPHIIKVHRRLISNVGKDSNVRDTFERLLKVAEGICATVVAEGIEDKEDFAALRDLGVELGQGFFLGVPVAIEPMGQVAS